MGWDGFATAKRVPEQLNGAIRLLPILGHPIRYARSPVRVTRTSQRRGRNALCIPMSVVTEGLDALMARLGAATKVTGLVATAPHTATAYAD